MSYAGDVTPEQAWETLSTDPDAVLVDCRTQAEWAFVGVPELGAIGKAVVLIEWNHFPGGHNDAFVDQLRAAGVRDDQTVLFLCRSGQRSIGAAQAATAAGVGKSYNILDGFEGGLDADGHRGSVGWRAVGLPWRQQ
ncbi:rhodanese-like domain-containing protein [Gordonia jinhuaensis]|uniref:Sulfurtransferase n=1 Tax=Gordonia jinhuaensis TaxID=1517702 RepID=A0A916WYI0_9ACTN|nr:rhodanese-like domain-containing protein [Gordonia jinhuaensis]GGB39344.1 sulfurtransferase [Gordonia jinhuaensis]